MVTIRLSRGGRKKRPFYAILVADQRRSTRGRFIERIGFYNPIAAKDEQKICVDFARIEHWVAQGAKPTARVVQICKLAKLEEQGIKPKAKKPRPSKAKRAKLAAAKDEPAAEDTKPEAAGDQAKEMQEDKVAKVEAKRTEQAEQPEEAKQVEEKDANPDAEPGAEKTADAAKADEKDADAGEPGEARESMSAEENK